MLTNLTQVLGDAREKHYAVGLFNTVNLEMAKGVLAAAEELRSPVIIGTAEILLPYSTLQELVYFLRPMAEKASVPVVLHYDHGLTEEKIHEAMELGFTSVMYDCSTAAYEENIASVARITREAHQRGITVEGELGHVGANASEEDHSIYTQPAQAADFIARTGVDALAVAIGTAHGAYKASPKLDVERLKEIASVVSTPLVLHGGSGLSDDDFRRCIAGGISKVNIFTDLNCAEVNAAVEHYQPGCGITDVMNAMTEAVKNATMKKMRVFGCDGRA